MSRIKNKKYMRVKWTALLFILILGVMDAQEGYNNDPNTDYSKCDNCLTFPEEFMQVDENERIDFTEIEAERQMDFLIGEWQLYYPEDKSPAFEIFKWFHEGIIVEGYQDWALDSNHLDKIPWRAKSFFRYVKEEERWQFQWITTNSYSIFSGKLEPNNTFVFYENEFHGDPLKLKFTYPAKYVFKNITKNSFVVEWYDSEDNGKTYPFLAWRLYYKRRANPFQKTD